jgi:hypothetical protein
MLGSIFRMAMLAGSGAGMAAGLRRAMVKLACLLAAAMVVSLLLAAAVAAFAFALYIALLPDLGGPRSAVAAGVCLVIVAGVVMLICRGLYRRRARPVASGVSGLGSSLGAAALGASMGGTSLPNLDIRGVLGRNAITVLLAAFVAGMVMNNRR